jgi:hypothetical protein
LKHFPEKKPAPDLIPAAGFFFSALEHDPEKACPGLDPGWNPVFGKDHAQTKS